MANLTPEERIRLRALQEEEYTRAALDTLGLTSSATIDSFNPKTKEEFTEFGEAICKKVSQFKNKEEYITFLDELVRNLCAGRKQTLRSQKVFLNKIPTINIVMISVSSTNIRKVKTSLDNLFLEKQKMEKGDKPKKKPGAGKVKARLRVEDDVSISYKYSKVTYFYKTKIKIQIQDDYASRATLGGTYEDDDYDDFM